MISKQLRNNPLVFVEDLDHPVIGAEDLRHLTGSKRLGPGASVNLADGSGAWVAAVLESADGELRLVSEVSSEPPSGITSTIVFAPTKGVKPEWVVQKLTEIGVHRIGLLRSERSIVQLNQDRSERLLRKMRKSSIQACQQSRRLRRPELFGVRSVDDWLLVEPDLNLCDPDGQPVENLVRAGHSAISLAVGPEGGWAPQERTGVPLVRLPGGVLRSDTAAIAAAVSIV